MSSTRKALEKINASINLETSSTITTSTTTSSKPVTTSLNVASSINKATFATNTTISNANSMLLLSSESLQSLDTAKKEDPNNLSLASAVSEGQHSLSGAPSASSSPVLSPPEKYFGRNANGTMVTTTRPTNEAEVQLYRVLQRASLLAYYDTLLEMGGDDVQQLYEAGEEEFLEIMSLVGMASKPLHVRRLQKALYEWANNPSLFQGPMISNINTSFNKTPTKTQEIFNYEISPDSLARRKFSTFNPSTVFNPTPLINTAQTSSAQLFSKMCTPTIIQPNNPPTLSTLPTVSGFGTLYSNKQSSTNALHQVSSSSPQLTPVLNEMQVSHITICAEKIAAQLPLREPRTHTSKKRTNRELEQVIAMSDTNPRRMDEIRKYSAIYGRFDCKRRPEKPLTLHEVCVNEAAAQLCRLVPALLTRRDELFPMARQIVKDAGIGHSASIARYGGLLTQMQTQVSPQQSNVVLDCESSELTVLTKRHRLLSNDTNLITTGPNRTTPTIANQRIAGRMAALNAAEQLAKAGVYARVIDPFTVKPLDTALILELGRACGGTIVVVEDHYQQGGLGEAVLSALATERNFAVKHLFVPTVPRSGPPTVLIDMFGISARHMVNAVNALLSV